MTWTSVCTGSDLYLLSVYQRYLVVMADLFTLCKNSTNLSFFYFKCFNICILYIDI